jgi:hypothetical protein
MFETKQIFSRRKSDGHLARVLSVAMLPALVASLYKALYLDPNLFAAINLVLMYAGLALVGYAISNLRSERVQSAYSIFGSLSMWFLDQLLPALS